MVFKLRVLAIIHLLNRPVEGSAGVTQQTHAPAPPALSGFLLLWWSPIQP